MLSFLSLLWEGSHCLHLLASVSNASMNTDVQCPHVLMILLSLLFGTCAEMNCCIVWEFQISVSEENYAVFHSSCPALCSH